MAEWGRKTKITCPHCKRKVMMIVGKVNRAKKEGYAIFCSRKCSGLAHRKNKSKAQKKAEKRLYDMEYRTQNKAILKVKKAEAFQNRSKARRKYEIEYRKKNMKRHVEYCQDEDYKEWKKEYDSKYRAKRMFGPFWEAYLLTLNIDREVNSRMSDYDVRVANGTLNKKLQRRREYEKSTCF